MTNEQDTMNYVGRRTDAILDSRTIRETFLGFEDIYKLGQASIIGFFLALMQGNEDFRAEDFKMAMEQFMKNDIQLRCDVYGVMAEYMIREDINDRNSLYGKE